MYVTIYYFCNVIAPHYSALLCVRLAIYKMEYIIVFMQLCGSHIRCSDGFVNFDVSGVKSVSGRAIRIDGCTNQIMGCSPLSPGANIVSCLVLSCLVLSFTPPFLDQNHFTCHVKFWCLIYMFIWSDICRYVSKDTIFSFVKCYLYVGISMHTFVFIKHLFCKFPFHL